MKRVNRKRNGWRLTESRLKQIVAESVKRVLRENQMPDENCYSVFYKDGDEANDYYLSKRDALELAMNLEDNGYEVIVAKNLGNEWETIYETK